MARGNLPTALSLQARRAESLKAAPEQPSAAAPSVPVDDLLKREYT
jgi:hypothetical protein